MWLKCAYSQFLFHCSCLLCFKTQIKDIFNWYIIVYLKSNL